MKLTGRQCVHDQWRTLEWPVAGVSRHLKHVVCARLEITHSHCVVTSWCNIAQLYPILIRCRTILNWKLCDAAVYILWQCWQSEGDWCSGLACNWSLWPHWWGWWAQREMFVRKSEIPTQAQAKCTTFFDILGSTTCQSYWHSVHKFNQQKKRNRSGVDQVAKGRIVRSIFQQWKALARYVSIACRMTQMSTVFFRRFGAVGWSSVKSDGSSAFHCRKTLMLEENKDVCKGEFITLLHSAVFWFASWHLACKFALGCFPELCLLVPLWKHQLTSWKSCESYRSTVRRHPCFRLTNPDLIVLVWL